MRPQYHYAAAANWLSDPNGLVHWNGEWHLFYQYNPDGEHWGNMSWGHAVSRDLAQWDELAPALTGDELGMIFSGSAVIDHANTAGFGAEAMVAIYTSASDGPQRQSQSIAWSNDHGRSWHKYAGNPVLDAGLADFREPNVFWHQPSGRWIMVVVLSDRNCAAIYGSNDLKQWEHLSDIGGEDAPGEVWECPLLIELPVEGGGRCWLFKVDVLRGAPGSGALYRTGSFDGTCFEADPQGWLPLDMGTDFYAAIAWHEPRDDQDRPLWIGWLGNHAYQGQLPLQGWRGAMSVPRRLSLAPAGESLLLRQELAKDALSPVPLADPFAESIPAAAKLELPGHCDFRVAIADADGRSLEIELRGSQLLVTRRDPSVPSLDAVQTLALRTTDAIGLWLDVGSLELLADGGCAALTVQHRLRGESYMLVGAIEPAAA
ncbi:MAG: glycoside hydrolase family 32 protein [Novosphingobium sp.]